MRARVDDFSGSDEQYISYLEREVLALRGQKAASNGISSPCQPHFDVAQDSACDLSNATSTQHRGKRLKRPRELEFIILDPGSLSHNPVKQYIPNPRWRDNANTLIAETPKAADWYSSLKKQGIYDIMSNGQAVAYLMAVDDQSPLPSEPASLGSSISDRLKGYALAATHRGSAASIALKLANFQKFLVLSACCVLRQANEQDCILEVISLCVGRSVTPTRGEDLLNTCRFVNRLMDTLYVHGWGLRGCELFLLWNRQPSFFNHLCHAKENSLRLFQASISTQEFTDVPETPLQWTSLFVPILVDRIIGGSVSIDRISELLGYTNSYFTRDNPWQHL